MRRGFTLILLAACIGCGDDGPRDPSIKEAVSPSYNVTRVSGGMFKVTTDVIELRYEGRKHVFLRFIYDERVTIEKIGDYPLSPEKTP